MAKSSKGNGAGEGGRRERGGFKSSRHGKASAAGPKAQQKLAAEEREKRGLQHTAHEASRFLKGQRIDPRRIDGKETVAELIEGTYLAYNAARLREARPLTPPVPDVYALALEARDEPYIFHLASTLRARGIRVVFDPGPAKLDAKLRKAARRGARLACLIGPEERELVNRFTLASAVPP